MGGTFQCLYFSRKESPAGNFEGGSKRGRSKEIETVVTDPRKECAPPLSSICQTLCPNVTFVLVSRGGDSVRKKKFYFVHPRFIPPHCLKVRWRRRV
ncbi:hypothetical protein CDAR_205101 [Caerostris darwini]|uniref:Uncharacterized protein n=1 Tax=Caerostris darwini TaxID=1538125 RepID=A0AAV4PUK9_9ARAC|nr:hypothetical protein CDAR_205101 [Caerostris darwini]